MKKLIASIVVCLCANFASAVEEVERQVTVYTSQNYPIQHAELANKIYYLDQVQQIEDKFAEQFPLESSRRVLCNRSINGDSLMNGYNLKSN